MVTKGELDAIVYLTEPSHRLDRASPCGSFVDEYVLNASRPNALTAARNPFRGQRRRSRGGVLFHTRPHGFLALALLE